MADTSAADTTASQTNQGDKRFGREMRRIWTQAIQDKDFGIIADWFSMYFFRTGFVALVVVGVAASLGETSWQKGAATGFRILALSLLIAGAATMCGWLLGLLFGIPRSLGRDGPAPPASGAAQPAPGAVAYSRVNSNLEDISDWLTKTIVGVGLTQFYSIAGFLGNLARDTNKFGFGWEGHGELLAIGLYLYFAPGGFWLGYVGTRTFLTGLFDMFSRPDGYLSDTRKLMTAAQIEITDKGIAPANPAQKDIDAKLRDVSIKDLTTNNQLMAWAGTQARQHNFDSARVALQNVLVDEPDNESASVRLQQVSLAELLSALYDTPPAGFEKAVRIGEQLAAQSRFKKDLDVHVWLACAYGQKYRYYKRNPKGGPDDQAVLDEAKEKTIREIKAALAIDPKVRARLFAYWQPAPGSIDNDLSGFDADDAEIGALLNPPAASSSVHP